MAMYDLSGVWMDGERPIAHEIEPDLRGSFPAVAWSVVLQGGHMPYEPVARRVALKLAAVKNDGLLSEDRAADPGDEDEMTESGDTLLLEGPTELRAS